MIDPAFYDKIYRNDGRWDKYRFMYDAFGAKSSTVFGAGMTLVSQWAPLFGMTDVPWLG